MGKKSDPSDEKIKRVLNKISERNRAKQKKMEEELNKEISKEDFTESFCRWEVQKDGEVFFPINKPKVTDTIPAGYYTIQISRERGYFLRKKEIFTDELIDLSSKEIIEIIDDIKSFWDLEEQYEKYNFVHKRGVLLYGPPGSGKSAIINLLIKDLIENRNGVIFSIDNSDSLNKYSDFVSSIFRKIEPNRPIISLFEDIDDLVGTNRGTERVVLNLLDGIDQITNVAYVATTNYPEKLAKRVANRPGRFDKRIFVGYPTAPIRKKFFESKFLGDDIKKFDIKKMVKMTKKFTLAHCKEFFAEVVIKGKEMEDVVEELKSLEKMPSSLDDDGTRKSSIGFGSSNTDGYDDDFEEIDWDSFLKK